MNQMIKPLSRNENQFDNVISQLNNLSSRSKSLVSPTSKLDKSLSQFNSLCSEINDVINAIHIASDGIEGANEAAKLCQGFPAPVGTVASGCSEVLTPASSLSSTLSNELRTFQSSILSPIKIEIRAVQRGVKVTQETLNFLSVQLPGYLTTLQMLNDLVKIANTLLLTFPDATCHAKLEKLLSSYLLIRDDVDKVLSPILPIINELLTIVTSSLHAADKANQTLAEVSKIDINDDFTKALKDVSDVMRKIDNGFGPLSSALKAAEKIGSKCVDSIINHILEITHTKGLLNSIESPMKHAIESWLNPLKDVPKKLETAVSNEISPKDLIKQPTHLSDLVSQLNSVMKHYLVNSDKQKKHYINELLSAFGNIKTDGPLPPPQAALLANRPEQMTNDLIEIPRVVINYAPNVSIFEKNNSPGYASKFAAFSNDMLTAADQPKSALNTLTLKSASIGKAYDDLASRAIALNQDQENINELTSLPDNFSLQVNDIQRIMGFIKTAGIFIQNLNTEGDIKKIINDVVDIADKQLSAAQALTSKVDNFKQQVHQVTDSVEGTVKVIASYSTLDNAASDLSRIAPYVTGVKSAQQRISAQFPKCQDSLSKMLDSNAASAIEALSSLDQHSQVIGTHISALDVNLTTYRDALKPVADNMQLISNKHMPMYNHLANQLGKLVAIFDPLSDLLSLDPDLCSGNKTVQQGRTAAINMGKTEMHDLPSKIEQIIKTLITEEMPITQLEKALDAATHKTQSNLAVNISNNLKSLDTATSQLSTELQSLGNANMMPMFGFGSITHWVKHHVIDPVESTFDKALDGLEDGVKALLKGLCSI
jgi:hypothetical protein